MERRGPGLLRQAGGRLLEKGIEPYVTLYHWDLPQALEDKGGWQNIDTAKAFAQYAAKLGEHFKGRVRHWFTINEIACIVGMGYGNGLHAPGLQLPLEGQFACWQHVVYAHCLAAQALRAADAANRVGFASTGRLCYPAGGSEADIAAARALTFCLPGRRLDLHPPDGAGPAVPGALAAGKRRPAAGRGHRARAGRDHGRAAPRQTRHARPEHLQRRPVRMGAAGPEYVERPTGYPRTAIGWPVEPDSLDWGPYFIAERYGLPLYISENGLSCNDWVSLDGQVHDPGRIDFTARYLRALASGIRRGADVRGYFHWSLMDNYEWHSGYSERFGPGVYGLPHRPPPAQGQRPLVRTHRRNVTAP